GGIRGCGDGEVARWAAGALDRDQRRSSRHAAPRNGIAMSISRAYDVVVRTESQPEKVTRRTALKAFGTGIGAAAALPWLSDDGLLAFARIQETNAAPQPKVLSSAQFQTLEALLEAIIPTDERAPGAKQARVADYIDLLLSESEPERTLRWMGGLAALDAEAAARFKKPFVGLSAGQVDSILQEISRNERAPQTALDEFFVMTKD